MLDARRVGAAIVLPFQKPAPSGPEQTVHSAPLALGTSAFRQQFFLEAMGRISIDDRDRCDLERDLEKPITDAIDGVMLLHSAELPNRIWNVLKYDNYTNRSSNPRCDRIVTVRPRHTNAYLNGTLWRDLQMLVLGSWK